MGTDPPPDPLWDEIRDPPMYYDRLGVPISLREWTTLMEDRNDPPYKRIAETHVGRWRISTVWLGLNHRWLPGGPPDIFETMVFDADGTPGEDWEMRRYSTEDQARQGHAEMAQLVYTLENVDPARQQARLDDLD